MAKEYDPEIENMLALPTERSSHMGPQFQPHPYVLVRKMDQNKEWDEGNTREIASFPTGHQAMHLWTRVTGVLPEPDEHATHDEIIHDMAADLDQGSMFEATERDSGLPLLVRNRHWRTVGR